MNKREGIIFFMRDYERLNEGTFEEVESLINLYPSFDYCRLHDNKNFDPTTNAILMKERILEENDFYISEAMKILSVVNQCREMIPKRMWAIMKEKFLLGNVTSYKGFDEDTLKEYENFFLTYVANRISKKVLEAYMKGRRYEFR